MIEVIKLILVFSMVIGADSLTRFRKNKLVITGDSSSGAGKAEIPDTKTAINLITYQNKILIMKK